MSAALRAAVAGVALIGSGIEASAQGLWSDPPFVETCAAASFTQAGGKGQASVAALAASPHGIEDLSSWRAEARFEAGILESGLSWRRIAHPLYREDLVSALLEARLPGAGVSIGAVPVVSLRAIEGFPGERSIALLVSAAWRAGRIAAVRLRLPVRASGRAAGQGPVLCCRARLAGIGLGVIAHSPDAVEIETRLMAALDLGGSAAIESSYAARAREVSGAFTARRGGGFRASVAWSFNPALGASVSVEVGRRWSW